MSFASPGSVSAGTITIRNFIAILVVLLSPPVLATGPSASDLIERAEKQLRGESSQQILVMKVVRSNYRRELKLRSWTLGRKKALVEILEPRKEEGVTSLRIDGEMWNYLPKTEQVIRVPSSMMLQSWMGSDFTNDDLVKMSSLSADYQHSLTREETLDGEKVSLITCTPKPNAPVVWDKILYWARKSDGLPIREEFYDDRGKLVRTLKLEEFKKMDDRVIPTRLTIEKASQPGELTTLTYEKVLYDRSIDQGLFDRDKLKRISSLGKDQNSAWYLTRLSGAAGE